MSCSGFLWRDLRVEPIRSCLFPDKVKNSLIKNNWICVSFIASYQVIDSTLLILTSGLTFDLIWKLQSIPKKCWIIPKQKQKLPFYLIALALKIRIMIKSSL